MQESANQSARDRLDHMRLAVEDLKCENRKLKAKSDGYEDELRASKSELKDLNKKFDSFKVECKNEEERLKQEKIEVIETNTR